MKQPAKPLNPQISLPLLKAPATAVSDDKQEELALTLMELLINAAREHVVPRANGGGDERPEAHR
jgi:hypothetical protein